MQRAKEGIRPPILAKALESIVIADVDGLELDKRRLESCALSKQRGERVRFDGVHIASGTLGETRLTQVTWLDVLCERCDLSMIDWPAAKLTRVEARGCRVTGAKLVDAELDDVRFVECQLDYASFAGGRFRRVAFERCPMKEVDFTEADLAGTSFVDCDLEGADLTRAKLHGADVSSSILREVRVGAGDLRGLVVSREQATVLAQLFGLVVRDT